MLFNLNTHSIQSARLHWPRASAAAQTSNSFCCGFRSPTTCTASQTLGAIHQCSLRSRKSSSWACQRARRRCSAVPNLHPLVSTHLASTGFWVEITSNAIFMAGFWGWAIAQAAKVFTCYAKKGIWDVTQVVSAGGMPSSHSSLCMGCWQHNALDVDGRPSIRLPFQTRTDERIDIGNNSFFLREFELLWRLKPGLNSLKAIVQAVTTAIGIQHGFRSSLFAMALCFSLIVMYDAAGVRRHAGAQAEVLNTVVSELLSMHAVSQKKLKEVLGHTPLQVFIGAVLGVVCGAVYMCYFGAPIVTA